ncbi:sugar phosphate isomerase/epimerase [Amnibacterium sp. CER49]|uniref:sugar phosphate isomerase/epimerase family protein n=1 Tax=Amnibacterium sp. CER49 TaxID=3039161 RepID=UPI00244C0D29|nr:sugar phosphate isomerase/epimerase [Amnibacterium sp. CER49]MDH2443818.1 sugar phosphate isomerase/epimerase [Amnibacterium sp. CER49]
MSDSRPDADTWPIAAAMLPFLGTTTSGTPVQDAPGEVWGAALAEVADAGFTEVDLTDSWVRPGDLTPQRLDELAGAIRSAGLTAPAISAIRRSVIDPDSADDNLAYSHRTIDAGAALGCAVVSVGLHRPLLPEQQKAHWFWTVDGPRDSDDPETWSRAVSRLRELGDHAASVGVQLSLEMYEDTLLGSADSAVRLVTDIGSDAVGLNPDLGNLYRLHRPIEPFLDALAKCLPHSNYWHVKSYLRLEDFPSGTVLTAPAPMDSGSMNYRRAIKMALEAGYTGPFCVEHYGGDGLAVAARNRDYLRGLLRFDLSDAASPEVR